MRKNKDKKFVLYKGTRFLLQKGHEVYQCNTDTGIVSLHKIKKSWTWFWEEGTNYKCTYANNIVHIPAFSIDKAVTEFKQMLRLLVAQRKVEGNPLVIRKELK